VGQTDVNPLSNLSEKEEPKCSVHGDRPIKVFCLSCFHFICDDCFGTIESSHSTHSRVSIEAGIARLKDELNELIEVSKSAAESNSSVIEQLTRTHQRLEFLDEVCINHFQRVVDLMKIQLCHVQEHIEKIKSITRSQGAKAVNALDNAKAIEQICCSVTAKLQPSSLEEYMRLRPAIIEGASRLKTSPDSDIVKHIEQFSIDDRTAAGQDDPDNVIPRVTMYVPENMKLFDVWIPQNDLENQNHPQVVRQLLHRKTSNDKLNS